MGCGPSMPKLEGFHVEQTVPASGFMLGDVASTADSQVVLRFPCGMSLARSSFDGPEPPSTCQVLDGNQTLLFTVHRAGAEPKSSMLSTIKPLRKPTIVRDPTGQVIAVLQTDATEPQKYSTGTNSYTCYSARLRFEGQAPDVTVEGVALYAWFKQWNANDVDHTLIYFIGPAGLEKPNAYHHDLFGAAFMPPWKFTTTTPAKAGVAFGAKVSGPTQPGSGNVTGLNEVTVAKGMDAGVVVLAAFCPALLEAEFVDSNN